MDLQPIRLHGSSSKGRRTHNKLSALLSGTGVPLAGPVPHDYGRLFRLGIDRIVRCFRLPT